MSKQSRGKSLAFRIDRIQEGRSINADDIPVSDAMIEEGLYILEEVNELPLSTERVGRAFRAMYLCGYLESLRESSGQ